MNSEEQARKLIDNYLKGKCSEEEKSLVEAFYLNQFSEGKLPGGLPKDRLKALMWEQVSEATSNKKRKFLILHWPRVAAVVPLFLLAGAGLFFVVRHEVSQSSTELADKNDIPPGGNKATLTLTDGRQIELSSEEEGISLNAGQLAYMDGTVLEKKLAEYAILTTPRGGQYQVALPDGSRIWLNAASSLKYPTSFEGLEQRRVELRGEAYFEVAKDPGHPFIVESDKQSVRVLGTHFNISAYPDESTVQTTLAEGSVAVTGKGNDGEQILRPGEQAVAGDYDVHVRQVDPNDALAWKNGQFQFNEEPLESIMHEVARWYDVEVIFEDEAIREYAFVGVIDRFSNISEVLDMLQLTGKVQFRIKGRKITVSAKL